MHFTGWKHRGVSLWICALVVWEQADSLRSISVSMTVQVPENENQTALWDELADHSGYDAQEIHIQATFRQKPSPVTSFFFLINSHLACPKRAESLTVRVPAVNYRSNEVTSSESTNKPQTEAASLAFLPRLRGRWITSLLLQSDRPRLRSLHCVVLFWSFVCFTLLYTMAAVDWRPLVHRAEASHTS